MNCILLALSESDVKNLPNAARALLNLGTQNVWLIYSPAITVSLAEATATFDKDIADLKAAFAAAKDRDDLDGAKKLKLDLEGKQLERKQAIGDAWKRVGKTERVAKAQALFAEFYSVCGTDIAVKPYMTEEHHDASELHNLLNLYQKVNPFGVGNYGVVFARGIGRNLNAPVVEQPIHKEGRSVTELFKGEPPTPKVRDLSKVPTVLDFDPSKHFNPAELEDLGWHNLKAVAKHRGINTHKMPKEAIIKEVISKTPLAPKTDDASTY